MWKKEKNERRNWGHVFSDVLQEPKFLSFPPFFTFPLALFLRLLYYPFSSSHHPVLGSSPSRASNSKHDSKRVAKENSRVRPNQSRPHAWKQFTDYYLYIFIFSSFRFSSFIILLPLEPIHPSMHIHHVSSSLQLPRRNFFLEGRKEGRNGDTYSQSITCSTSFIKSSRRPIDVSSSTSVSPPFIPFP